MSLCPICNQKVFFCEAVYISSRSYHGKCCKCNYVGCCTRLSSSNYYFHQNRLFCKKHVFIVEKHPEMITPIPEGQANVQLETRISVTRGSTRKIIPEPEPPPTYGKEFFIQREKAKLQKEEQQKQEQEAKLNEKKKQEQEKKDWFEKIWFGKITTTETHTDVLVIVFSMLGLSPALCCCACTCKRWYKLITMTDGVYDVWYKKYLGPQRRFDWNWRDVICHVKSKTPHMSNLMRWYSGPEVEWNVTHDTLCWIVEGGFEKALEHILNVWLPLVKNKRSTISTLFGLDSWYPTSNVMYWAMKSRNTRMMDLLLHHGAVFPQFTSGVKFNLELLEDQQLVNWILTKPVLAKMIFIDIIEGGDIKLIKKVEAMGFPLGMVWSTGSKLWNLAFGGNVKVPETEQDELREWLFEKKLEGFIDPDTIIKLIKKNDIPTIQLLKQGGVNLNISSISRILSHSRANSQRSLEQECPLDLFTYLVTDGGVTVILSNFFEPGAACVQPDAVSKLQILRKTGGYTLQGTEVSQAIISGCKIEIFKELVEFPGFTPSADLLKPFNVSPKVVGVFLEAGMNINQLVEGRNMLQWALDKQDKALATFLIKHNIDVDPVTDKMPPLALAVMKDVIGMSALLIKAGANIQVSVKALDAVDGKLAQKLRDIAAKLGK